MSKIPLAAALVAAGLLASPLVHAADAAAPANAKAATTPPIKGPTLAASANRALAADDVPSVRDRPMTAKQAADADLARRNAQPRLKAQRENLKEDAAAQALARRQKPSTYDRDIQMGDKDHTEQVTDVKVFVKK